MFYKSLFIFTFFVFSSTQAQSWLQSADSSASFFEIQNKFYTYWNQRPMEKGAGYTVFKRWEWFWETRVGQSGQFPNPNHDRLEWNKFDQNSTKRNSSKSWRSIGPFTTPSGYHGLGRINCVAFHPSDKFTFWVGTPGGGIWKTDDMGYTWTTTSDKNPVLGVSSIAIHPTVPDTMYIATGDGDRGSLSGMTGGARGDSKSVGVLMSSDGGKTWKTTGLNWQINQSFLIRTLIMNPKKPWILHCATSDGIYRTLNAGKTWTRAITGYYMDIEFKPNNPNVIFATSFDLNGNARIYRSLNGGANYTSLRTVSNGSRIKIATTAANPSKVHFLVAHKTGGGLEGLYETLDSGNTIALKFNTSNLLSNKYDGSGTTGQGWYDLAYAIAPNNENIAFLGGVNTWKSTNGGSNWTLNNFWTGYEPFNPNRVTVVHADKHFLMYHPLDNSLLFECNDGGIYMSSNAGSSWTDITGNMAITQFYRIGYTESDSSLIIGGTQDNGARVFREEEWYEATGGDGMECAIDYNNSDIIYSSYAYGRLYRSDDGFLSGNYSTISENIPEGGSGAWVTPFLIDPNEPSSLFAAYKRVYVSHDYGETWDDIFTGVTNNSLLRNLAVAKGNSRYIYVGDYYNIWKTDNGGTTWTKIVSSSPQPITMIKVHPSNHNIIYYTLSSYSAGNKVIKFNSSKPIGSQRENISSNLPNISVNCIQLSAAKNEAMYIGTDLGVFYRDSSSNSWEVLNGNLPNVVVTDIEVNMTQNKLVAATYGRGIWQTNLLDEELTKVVSLNPAQLSINNSIASKPVINYNKPIVKGIGTIVIKENDEIVSILNVDSSAVSINGTQVEINPGVQFKLSSTVDIEIPNGTFVDLLGYNVPAMAKNAWQFNIEAFVSIEDLKNDQSFKLFPNPVHQLLNVSINNDWIHSEYEIFDFTGKLIEKGEFNALQNEVVTSAYQSGLYSLKMSKGQQVKTQYFIVNH